MRAVIAGQEFVGDRENNALIESAAWFIPDRPDGWIGVPSPRAESQLLPGVQGGDTPRNFLFGPRTLAASLFVVGVNASLGRAAAEDWLGSLSGNFPFLLEDEHGPRELPLVYQSAEPNYRIVSTRVCEFTMFVTAPDPIKYGSPMRMPAGDGVVDNAGNIPVFPRNLTLHDAAIGIGTEIELELFVDGASRRVRWLNPLGVAWDADTIVINLRSMTASGITLAGAAVDLSTGIIEDDLSALPPGFTEYSLSTNAAEAPSGRGLSMEVRPGWM